MINITKGLDLPIDGQPQQVINEGPEITKVALLASDYPGLRPMMAVDVGTVVKKGQTLFEDKKNPGVRFTSPIAGTVVAINRGERRAFQSIVIEGNNSGEFVKFKKTTAGKLLNLSQEDVVNILVESGMWTSFRTRPFDKVPTIGTLPHSIFVNTLDTNPLAADPKVIINADADAFVNGVKVLTRLGIKIFVCKNEGSIPAVYNLENVQEETFVGPHPAGLPGTHIHFLDPVSEEKTVWHINYQDVIAIGHLFVEGELYNKKVISLAGPCVKEPKLLTTIKGAFVDEIVKDQLVKSERGVRVVAGSVLWGHKAEGPFAYLGNFQLQVSALEEGTQNDFLGWAMPGAQRHSVTTSFLSSFKAPESYIINTAINGGSRPMVPIGSYEKVMPLDIEPTMLLRAIEINDVDQAKLLGILELAEEDLALCTYVCPGKQDYGSLIRRSLTKIELEG